MDLANSFLQSFLDGNFNPKDFIVMQLRANNTRLSNFLAKEFESKKIKVDIDKFKEKHQIVITLGKKTEWRLIDNVFYAGQYKGAEYVVPIADKQLAIAAVPRHEKAKVQH